jgi:hypothetical protein
MKHLQPDQGGPRHIVIFAGYPAQMQRFLNTNPGLSRRIPYTFTFEEYDSPTLAQLFITMARRGGQTVAHTATDEESELQWLQSVLSDVLDLRMPPSLAALGDAYELTEDELRSLRQSIRDGNGGFIENWLNESSVERDTRQRIPGAHAARPHSDPTDLLNSLTQLRREHMLVALTQLARAAARRASKHSGGNMRNDSDSDSDMLTDEQAHFPSRAAAAAAAAAAGRGANGAAAAAAAGPTANSANAAAAGAAAVGSKRKRVEHADDQGRS